MLHRPGRSYTPRALGAGRSPRWGENVVRRALLGKCDFCAGCPWAEGAPPRSGDVHRTSAPTPAMWSGARFTERAGAVSVKRSFLFSRESGNFGAVPFQSVSQSVSSVQFSSVQLCNERNSVGIALPLHRDYFAQFPAGGDTQYRPLAKIVCGNK